MTLVPLRALLLAAGLSAMSTALAQEFAERGAPVIAAGGARNGTLTLPSLAKLHPALEPLALIQSFYGLAAALSVARGFDPDKPPHLNKVTATR